MGHEYILEIYLPGSTKDVWISFQSDQPFMDISVGNLINPAVWKDYGGGPKTKVSVVGVEHLIYEVGEKVGHKMLIYTEKA
jgi:hypothetical protein